MTAKLEDMTNQKENSSAKFNSIITILDADLLESRQMEERLVGAMKMMEGSHAEALALVEDEKNGAIQELESTM